MADRHFTEYFSEARMSERKEKCWMSQGEICESFRTAKDQHNQLYLLSQLNNVKVFVIVEILEEHGYIMPKNWQSIPCYKPGRKRIPIEGDETEELRKRKRLYNERYKERKRKGLVQSKNETNESCVS